jgi:hypothetical protein
MHLNFKNNLHYKENGNWICMHVSVWCSGKQGSREGEVTGSNPTRRAQKGTRLATLCEK